MSDLKLDIAGFLGAGGKLIIEDEFLKYKHPYGKRFSVRLNDVDTVSTDALRGGKAKLKIIGKGTVLAEIDMPIPWAEKCQKWILNNLKK